MALIKCSECNNEVSDTAKNCPKCGAKIVNKIKEEKKKKNKSKIIIFGIIVAVLIAISTITLFIINQKRLSTYKKNYEDIIDKIYDSARKTEDALSLYRKVWYNTIWEEDDIQTDKYTKDATGEFNDDFNDSLTNLWISSDYSSKINDIKIDSLSEIPSLYKKLKNPPKKMKNAFDDLEELYDAYLSFTDMALNPSGSLNSFTNKYNELDDKVASLYKKAYRNIE